MTGRSFHEYIGCLSSLVKSLFNLSIFVQTFYGFYQCHKSFFFLNIYSGKLSFVRYILIFSASLGFAFEFSFSY